jgi:dienelactone hydrolase
MFSVVLGALLTGGVSGVIPNGSARLDVNVGGRAIAVYTYKPDAYRDGPMLLVIHGLLRDAGSYRDAARGMADRFGSVVVVPEFDLARFPFQKFTRGGVIREDGSVAPRDEWTWGLLPKLADELRRREGRPGMPYYIIGHSAGGQCAGRIAGFVETGAAGIVSANPGSLLFPTRRLPFPYGFGGLPDDLSDDEAIRRYLAQPLTIFLGAEDTRRDENLDISPEADLQGSSRRERGRRAYEAGRKLAVAKGWEFRWVLIEARGVGHDRCLMFDSPESEVALFGRDGGPRHRRK